MSRRSAILVGCFAMAMGTFWAAPASAAVDIYGSYTDGVSGVTAGDAAPTINLSGGLKNTDYFNVDNLVPGGSAGYAYNDPNGLLFTVDPASCITNSCPRLTGEKTETATISVDFTFYNAQGGQIGTLTDSALATFNYFPNANNDDDNLCWSNSAVGGTAVISSQLVGTCGAPGATVQTAYEQIQVALNGANYDVNLYDWNDWNEQPTISFQLLKSPSNVPEPASLALLAVGLLGLGGLVAVRRRRVAAQAV